MPSQERKRPQTPISEAAPRREEQPLAAFMPAMPAMPAWRGWDLWLRVAGVAVAVVGGIVCSLPTAYSMVVFLVLPLVVGVASAALLRSWWAILIVPVAFRVGFLLIGVPLAGGFDSIALSSSDAAFEVLATLYGLNLVPVALGLAIGVPIGKDLQRRLQPQPHQPAAPSPSTS